MHPCVEKLPVQAAVTVAVGYLSSHYATHRHGGWFFDETVNWIIE